MRGLSAVLWRRRGTRIALLCVLVSLPLLGGGFVLLRHSSFVAVEKVRVSGLHGPEARAIESALVAAGRRMSTLDVRQGALRSAVSPFRVVREVRASAHFPHGLSISVVEQLPVAALVVAGQRTAVAADGVVLGPALLRSSLPTVNGYVELAAGQHLNDAGLLASVSVLGAAPSALRRQVARVYEGPQGLTLAMQNGLLAYFGDATRPHAKWLSLARVLGDQSSAGATYIDVRLPARPAAGFPAGAGPTFASSGGEQSQGGSESTVGALAAGLAGPSGESSSPAGSEPKEASEAESSSSTSSGESSESSSARSQETGSESNSQTTAEGGSQAPAEAPAAGG